jgi:hypothetical protein
LLVLFRKENFLFWKSAQELKPKDSNEYWNEQYKNFMVNLYMQANNTSPSLDLLFENTHIHLIRLRKELGCWWGCRWPASSSVCSLVGVLLN